MDDFIMAEGVANELRVYLSQSHAYLDDCKNAIDKCNVMEELGFDNGDLLNCQSAVGTIQKALLNIYNSATNCEEEFLYLDMTGSDKLTTEVFGSDGEENTDETTSGLIPDVKTISNDYNVIDYTVSKEDLTHDTSITINDKNVDIYTSSKTNAKYVISNGLDTNERKELRYELKNCLDNDEMAIVTYNNDCYQYDISDKNDCTSDYSVVGKTETGKMYAFELTNNSEKVVDDGSSNHTLMTSVNGMVIDNKMNMVMEEGANLTVYVMPKDNVNGKRTITEYTRLSFSGGANASKGGEYATVKMTDEWKEFTNINVSGNRKNVITIGNGSVERKYTKDHYSIGNISNKAIPVVIDAKSPGKQTMQGTVGYEHEGSSVQYSHEGEDTLLYYQEVVSHWGF